MSIVLLYGVYIKKLKYCDRGELSLLHWTPNVYACCPANTTFEDIKDALCFWFIFLQRTHGSSRDRSKTHSTSTTVKAAYLFSTMHEAGSRSPASIPRSNRPTQSWQSPRSKLYSRAVCFHLVKSDVHVHKRNFLYSFHPCFQRTEHLMLCADAFLTLSLRACG